MDHVVYVDAKAGELEALLSGAKTMITRGATGRKLPHGRVSAGDTLYLIRNNGEGLVRARAVVSAVLHSDKLTPEESASLLAENQPALQLTPAQTSRWAGKRYLSLVTVSQVQPVEPFPIDRRAFGNMDDWLLVEDIRRVTASS